MTRVSCPYIWRFQKCIRENFSPIDLGKRDVESIEHDRCCCFLLKVDAKDVQGPSLKIDLSTSDGIDAGML